MRTDEEPHTLTVTAHGTGGGGWGTRDWHAACADLYVKYCEEFGWMLEDDKLAAMRAKNDAELKQCDERCVTPRRPSPPPPLPPCARRAARTPGCPGGGGCRGQR